MKLKITDEKLDELSKKYSDEFNEHFAQDDIVNLQIAVSSVDRAYKNGFRAAESHHQSTIDKLLQIVEMQREALSWCPRYDISVNPPIEMYSFRKTQAVILETNKMMKELKGQE